MGAIEEFLEQQAAVDLLRLTTAGSVDDGKSTLIGRLRDEAQALCEDTIAAVRSSSKQRTEEEIDFSLFTDGLSAEREQGITIDVAFRYFSTPKRRFIIADTPGHEQYTRNMVTGASTADLAILLIDAGLGITTQSKRHAFIASLLGIPHILVAVNKMDLVDYSREVFERIRSEYDAFAAKLDVRDLAYIPVSALRGDNVVRGRDRMPWYEGGSLLFNRLFMERVVLTLLLLLAVYIYVRQSFTDAYKRERAIFVTACSSGNRPSVRPSQPATTCISC